MESPIQDTFEYFTTAMHNYLEGLIQSDTVETVQGLLLITVFAINEA